MLFSILSLSLHMCTEAMSPENILHTSALQFIYILGDQIGLF